MTKLEAMIERWGLFRSGGYMFSGVVLELKPERRQGNGTRSCGALEDPILALRQSNKITKIRTIYRTNNYHRVTYHYKYDSRNKNILKVSET